MIVETHTLEDMQIATRVTRSMVLLRVQPTRLVLSNRLPELGGLPDNTQILATFSRRGGDFKVRDYGVLDVFVGAEVRFFARDSGGQSPKPEDDDFVTKIEAEYAASYRIPDGPVPSDIESLGFPAFSRITAVHTCWPYIRHQVHQLACEMGIPFVLPTLVHQPPKKGDGSVEAQEADTES